MKCGIEIVHFFFIKIVWKQYVQTLVLYCFARTLLVLQTYNTETLKKVYSKRLAFVGSVVQGADTPVSDGFKSIPL